MYLLGFFLCCNFLQRWHFNFTIIALMVNTQVQEFPTFLIHMYL
jgi:hypothetical protein